MRKSVLSGLLVCAVVFTITPGRADALTDELLPNNDVESPAFQLVAVVDNLQDKVEEIAQVEEKNKPKVHLVEEEETLVSIAKEYDTSWKKIYDKNDKISNPDVINVGEKLTIPKEDEEVKPRELPVVVVEAQKPAVKSAVASAPASVAPARTRGSSANNLYTAGNCTWYVKSKRGDLPNNLGNANTWFQRAAAQGMATGYAPRVGAVGQRGNHVVYIEKVNPDGTVTFSEMNYRSLYAVTTRTLPADSFRYIY